MRCWKGNMADMAEERECHDMTYKSKYLFLFKVSHASLVPCTQISSEYHISKYTFLQLKSSLTPTKLQLKCGKLQIRGLLVLTLFPGCRQRSRIKRLWFFLLRLFAFLSSSERS